MNIRFLEFILLPHFLLCSLLLFGVGPAIAADIAPLTAKYNAEVKGLDESIEREKERLQRKYLDQLAAGERAASKDGKVAALAAILKEREAAQAGTIRNAAVPGLPGVIESQREDFVKADAALIRQFSPRFAKAAGEYLRNLATIESTLPSNSPLRKQIAAEKQRLVVSAGRILTEQTFANTEWLMGLKVWQFHPNGKIITDTGDAKWFGWRILGPDSFAITANGQNFYIYKVAFTTMKGTGYTVGHEDEKPTIVYKGPLVK